MKDLKTLTQDTPLKDLIQHYNKYLIKTAISVAGYDDEDLIQDLVQEGNIAIWTSTQKYNADSQITFHQYLIHSVKYAMCNYMTINSRTIKLPPSLIFENYHAKLKKDIVTPNVKISIDQPINNDTKLADLLEDIATIDTDTLDHNQYVLKTLINGLKQRDKYMVEQYFIKGRNLEEIAIEQGVSKQRISQIVIAAINKIQAKLGIPITTHSKFWKNLQLRNEYYK